MLLLFMATSAVADDASLKDSEKRLIEILDTYEQTCVQTGLRTNLANLFKPNTGDSAKACDPQNLENQITSVLSDTNDKTKSDSNYRQWYDESISRLKSIVNGHNSYSSSSLHKDIEKQFLNSSVINGLERDTEAKISTVRGFRTLHGN